MFSKLVTIGAIAGLASAQGFNAGDGLVTTVTTFTTQEITVTSCEPTVTYCPARVTMTTYPIVTTLPGIVTTLPGAVVTANPVAVVSSPAPTVAVIVNPTGASGTGANGGAIGNTATYYPPGSPTGTGNNGGNGAYTGPSYTGAGSKLAVGGAVFGGLAAAVALL